MKTVKVQDYILTLKRGVGLDRAIKIAASCMNATHPSTYSTLPAVFESKDNRGHTSINTKELARTHAYWTQAYHLLRKKT